MRNVLTSTLCATVLLLGAASAWAGDAKHYSGSTCQSNQTAIRHAYGRARNASTTDAIWLECPVLKDTAHIDSGWVRVIDQNFGDDVRCYLWSLRSDTAGWSGHFRSAASAGTNSNPQTLEFSSMSSFSDGSYFLTCLVPPVYSGQASSVVAYRVREGS